MRQRTWLGEQSTGKGGRQRKRKRILPRRSKQQLREIGFCPDIDTQGETGDSHPLTEFRAGEFPGHNTNIDKLGKFHYVLNMARLARVIVPGLPHHVMQRGNRWQETFFKRTTMRPTWS